MKWISLKVISFLPIFPFIIYSNIKKINEKYFSLLKNFEKNFFTSTSKVF